VRVTVRLFGPFRIGRFKEEVRDLPPEATPRAVVEQLRIPAPLLGTALINGLHADLDAALADGDELTILPILEGG
jgi:molybdopterin converting factor small subunit